jgi:hypothetical protein
MCFLYAVLVFPLADSQAKPYAGQFMLQFTLDGCHYYIQLLGVVIVPLWLACHVQIFNGSARAAVEEYWRNFSYWKILSGMFSCVGQALCQSDSLPGVSMQSEMEVLPDMNIWDNVLILVQGSPWAPTPRIAYCSVCHVRRCGEFCVR